MELLVLSTLKWRMQSVTPFNFIDHYLHKMFNEFDGDGDQGQIIPLNRASILRSTQLILSTVKGQQNTYLFIFVLCLYMCHSWDCSQSINQLA